MLAGMPEGTDRTVTRRAGLVAVGTLLSRVLGAVRDAVIAATFAVASTDAFFVAFTIPNALRVLLGEGAISGAFVPVFSDVRERGDPGRERRFLAGLAGTMTVLLGLVTIAGVVAAPGLVTVYAAGYLDDPARFELTVMLTRLSFPYIFFIGLAGVGIAALHALGRFTVPSFSPSLLNVAVIAAPFVLVPVAIATGYPPIAALAFGVLAGGLLQAAVQLPPLARAKLVSVPRPAFRDPDVQRTLKLLVPLLAGLGVYQLNVILSRLFASFLPAGAQSYLYYSQRLAEIPQGMFALAIATATLPTLSALRARGEEDELKRVFRYALRLTLFVALPSAVGLVVLAEPAVTVLFGRGEFGTSQVAETARCLAWQAAGIWAVASVRVTVPMFHAHQDTRTPVIASAVNLVTFVAVSLTTMGTMAHAGIAAAMSAGALAQLAALVLLLRRRVGAIGLREVGISAGRTLAASVATGAVAWSVSTIGVWEEGGNEPMNIAVLGAAVAAGGLVHLTLATSLGAPEVEELRHALRRRTERRR